MRELLGDAALPPLWYWAAGLAHALRGEAGEALHLAERGTAAHPEHPVLLQLRGVLLEAAGDLAGAERLLRDALQRDPGIPQTSKALGDVLYRVGRLIAETGFSLTAARVQTERGLAIDRFHLEASDPALIEGSRLNALREALLVASIR